MGDDYPANRADDVRLSQRAVEDDDWIAAFLSRQPTCVLGLVDDGSPYVVNQLFVYDPAEHAIFLHGANTGRTRTIVERGDSPDASLTVSRMGRLLPAAMPVDFDVEYASVVVDGEIGLVEDPAKKRLALERIMEKFAPHMRPGEDYDPIADSSIERTSVYRIDVDGWSAKRNEKPPDFDGAYDYETVHDEDG
ncbi:pyridoxamine 5'-phosphate oxidase family protein [Halobacteriaceae archaeon GCM10025711]